jgi:hypothetical protein
MLLRKDRCHAQARLAALTWHALVGCFLPKEDSWGGARRLAGPVSEPPYLPLVLQEFSKEERDPVKTHEGWGVMLPCNPPAHYPGEWGA